MGQKTIEDSDIMKMDLNVQVHHLDRPVVAADITCPKCSAAIKDIEPSFSVSLPCRCHSGQDGVSEMGSLCMCDNGHMITISGLHHGAHVYTNGSTE